MKKLIVIFLALLLLFSVALAEEARTLQYGDKGEDVLTLQTRMKELLYYNGPLSGEFGDLTRKAVRRVQEAYDLEQTGAADAALQEIIYGDCYRKLTYEMTGKDVQQLQEALGRAAAAGGADHLRLLQR